MDEKRKLSTSSESKLQRRRKPSRDHEYQENIQWPQWDTLQRKKRFGCFGFRRELPEQVDFTIRIEPNVSGYTKDSAKNVLFVYQDTVNCVARIRRRLYDTPGLDIASSLQRLVGEGIMAAVSTSNMIDGVGCGMTQSLVLCEAVLADERLMYHGLSPRSLEYKKRLEHITRDHATEPDYRKRREVVNHMAAFSHLANKFVGDGLEFTEHMLKETHGILCRDLDKIYTRDSATKANTFAGRYRKEDLYANTHKYLSYRKVKRAMRKFVKALNGTLRKAEQMQELDPFFVATAASAHFVNIHPFLTGNGRMARMVMNVILLKYAGITVPVGADEKEQKIYLGIAARRSHAGKGDGELARYILFKANRALKSIERGLHSDIAPRARPSNTSSGGDTSGAETCVAETSGTETSGKES